jgi:hypothetical protein
VAATLAQATALLAAGDGGTAGPASPLRCRAALPPAAGLCRWAGTIPCDGAAYVVCKRPATDAIKAAAAAGWKPAQPAAPTPAARQEPALPALSLLPAAPQASAAAPGSSLAELQGGIQREAAQAGQQGGSSLAALQEAVAKQQPAAPAAPAAGGGGGGGGADNRGMLAGALQAPCSRAPTLP